MIEQEIDFSARKGLYRFSGYTDINNQLANLRKSGESRHIPVILKDTETYLINLLSMLKPLNILEIGTAVGYSAAVFATVCPNAKITSLEFSKPSIVEAEDNLKNFGLSHRIKIIEGEAGKTMEELSEKVKNGDEDSFDFIFIDGGKSHYRRFWDLAVNLGHKGSLIVCDNIYLRGCIFSEKFDPERKHLTSTRKMKEFVDFLMDYQGADSFMLPVGDGLTMSVLK